MTSWCYAVIAISAISAQAAVPRAAGCTEAATLLRSSDIVEKAWGAHLAAECGLAGLVPDIERELAALQPEVLASSVPGIHKWTGRVMISALIRLRQPVRLDLVEAIARGFPVEGVVLMLQYPERTARALMAVRKEREDGAVWIAATNALVRMRAPGIAAALIREVRFSHTFVVSDTGVAPLEGSAGSILGGISHYELPAELPPVNLYEASSMPGEGDPLISDGRVPIFLRTTVLQPGSAIDWAPTPIAYCRDCLRIGYISDLAGLPDAEVQAAVQPTTALRWHDVSRFHADVEAALSKQERAIRQLTARLLEADEAPAVKVSVIVKDRRHNKTQSIPEINASPGRS